ncbi:MAG: prepilin-type N-terminal cleavage/methylation domain-containing protein [Planctomycetes bacterium]|nr:prepilin-type N-terminal cleavage/methylation domain-containing protein [Planctomycetota bacterium]
MIRAFTLIELLVVVAIMLALMAMLLPLGQEAMYRAKATKTVRRIDDVFEALTRVGMEDGGPAAALQRRANLGGVITFTRDVTQRLPEPAAGGGAWQTVTARHRFGFPWNREDLLSSGDPDQATVVRDGVNTIVSSVTLGQLDSSATVRLLELAGALPRDIATTPVDESAVAYAGRSQSSAWNDAWGGPLAIGFGLYQPDTSKRVADAVRLYRFSRAVYIAVAAGGPSAPTPIGDPIADAAMVWQLANQICQPTSDTTWDERAFVAPPWRGVKQGREADGERRRALLSAPADLR